MKILILDTYYPQFLETFKVFPQIIINPGASYETELARLMLTQFGTSDFYSRNLKAIGWDADDFIVNCEALMALRPQEPIKADVLFLQDLSINISSWPSELVAGQCSCPWPGDDNIRKCSVVFTSFPHYVARIDAVGSRAVYNPLAFEPSVLSESQPRLHDCVFVGGVGAPSHWRYGMEVLKQVAERVPSFKWWGYGLEHVGSAAMRWSYRGEAWGRKMYEIYQRSTIVLNRHGEVAEGYANNMRMFEATGCGALLVTEYAPNIRDFFAEDECVTYKNPNEAVEKIRYYIDHDEERAAIAAKGQARTLRDHTYAKRMKTVSDVLQEMLCPA